MNFLKKFSGISDATGVTFEKDNLLMVLTSNRKGSEGLRTLSVLISDGDTAVLHRIANNVAPETDVEEIFDKWVENSGGDENSINGVVYANHNIMGMGRPIILNETSVQIDKDYENKFFVVSRFARWYPEGKKDGLTEQLKKTVENYERLQDKAIKEMKMFKELDDEKEYKLATANYRKHRANASIIDEKILCLETPYIAGTGTAIVTEDEKQAKEAFKNSGLDFDKFFPNGLAGGADPEVLRESENKTNTEADEETETETETGTPHKDAKAQAKEKATA